MVSQNTRKSCRLVKSMNVFEKEKNVVSVFFRQRQGQRKEEMIRRLLTARNKFLGRSWSIA